MSFWQAGFWSAGFWQAGFWQGDAAVESSGAGGHKKRIAAPVPKKRAKQDITDDELVDIALAIIATGALDG